MLKYEVSEHYEQLVEALVKKGLFGSKEDFIDMAIGKTLTEYYGVQNMPIKKKTIKLNNETQIDKDKPIIIECRVQRQGDGLPGYIRPSKDDEVSSVLPCIHEDFKLKICDKIFNSYITRANAINVAYDEIYPKRMGPKGHNHLKAWFVENNIKVRQYVYLAVRDLENNLFELLAEKPTFDHHLIVCR